MSGLSNMDKIFEPRAISVVGVSSRMDHPGNLLLRSIINVGFEGDLYPVNPKYEEIHGLPCFPSITALPVVPDLVIMTVPPAAAVPVLRECADFGVPYCIINTAGFSESGTEEGGRLEEELRKILEGSDLRVIGPNCMGVYSSRGKVALFDGMVTGGGRAGCISQSGSLGTIIYLLGMEKGVEFSKIVSTGNELDLTCSDFLEYMAQDPDIQMIIAYIEESRGGRRFLDIALDIKGRKPLIVWKTGLTESGRMAALSHTGSVSGESSIWKGVARQAGIITVDDIREMMDCAAALYHLPPPKGIRLGIISPPGGVAVGAADAAENEGLEVPSLAPGTIKELKDLYPPEGTSYANPVDMGFASTVPGSIRTAIEILDGDPNIDMILAVGGAPASRKGDLGLMRMHSEEIKEAKNRISKPLVGSGLPVVFAMPYLAELSWQGIPCYQTPRDACRALAKYARFYHHT